MFFALILSTVKADIVITELNFNPPGPEETLEFIEIYNTSPVVEDISGYRFVEGISFTFPKNTLLQGRSYLVVCADEDAIQAAYGITNTIGNYLGRLENGGEEIVLNVFAGGEEASVDFRERGRWVVPPDGTGHTLSIRNPYMDADDPESWVPSATLGGTPGRANFPTEPTIIDNTIIDTDEFWRYRKGNSAFPTSPVDWKTLAYDDSSWSSGRTGIGYDDGDDVTTLNDMRNNYASFAARKVFNLTQEDIDGFDQMTFEVNYDDGFVAYLNGTEIGRSSNMGNTGQVLPNTFLATAGREAGSFDGQSFSKNLLQEGDNVLAVQIHNTTLNSSDSSFIPRLISRTVIPPDTVADAVPIVFNEVYSRTSDTKWFELFNKGGSEINLGGYFLSDDPDDLDKFEIPADTMIAGRGFLIFEEGATGLDLSSTRVQLFLTQPNLERVVSGVNVGSDIVDNPHLEDTSEARIPDGSLQWVNSDTPTLGAANDYAFETRIVINELHYNPMPFNPAFGNLETEFIELYNRGEEAVDLTGFEFDRGVDFVFPDGTTIEPDEYLVIAGNVNVHESVYFIQGILGPWEGTLSNGGERVRLVDPLGNVADEVRYGEGGKWPKWADGGGASLELLDPFADNSSPAAWANSDESEKSQWQQVNYSVTYAAQQEHEFHIRMRDEGIVRIDSIQLTRGGSTYISNGTFDSNTSGWRIEGNHIQSRRITSDSFAGNGCLEVIATGRGDTRANRIEDDLSSLSSGTVQVTMALKWIRGANLMHFAGYNNSMAHIQRIAIPQDQGTPGAPNSIKVDNLGPVISDVKQDKAAPLAGQAVNITAHIRDIDGVDSARIRYRTGSPNGAYSTVTMHDDGAHNDGFAGDGIYGGTIPGNNNRVKVIYYIEATDGEDETYTFPVSAPSKTLMYQHDDQHTSPLDVYRIILNDADNNELNSRRLHSNELLNGSFVFEDDEIYQNVGVRYRGSPWQRPGNPRMFRFRFNKDERFRKHRNYNISRYGVRQNERTAYHMVWKNSSEDVTAPKGKTTNIKVYRNGSLHSVMEHIQPINGDYLRRWFPQDSDGILMKLTGKLLFDDNGGFRGGSTSWCRLSYQGADKERYRYNFNLRSRELEDDYQPLFDLLTTMSNTPTSQYDDAIAEILDTEQFMRVIAARVAHDDWDTVGIGNGQNCYMYYASIEGRWKLLPWDMDNTWRNANARTLPNADTGTSRLIARPNYRRQYNRAVHHMMNNQWNSAHMYPIWDAVHAVVGQETSQSNPGGLKSFMNSRRGQMNALLPSNVSFRIRTNSGNDFDVDESIVEIEGDGWVNIETILVGTEPLDLFWRSSTIWQAQIPVFFGENELEFTAFDGDGNVLATDSITVTSSVGWPEPVLQGVEPGEGRDGGLVTLSGVEFHEGIRVFFGDEESPLVIFDEENDPNQLQARVVGPEGETVVRVENADGRSSETLPFTILSPLPKFIRGDANLDGKVELGDAIKVLLNLYRGGELLCEDAADSDDNEVIEMADAVYILEHIYLEGPALSQPYPEKGLDGPNEDGLDCLEGI